MYFSVVVFFFVFDNFFLKFSGSKFYQFFFYAKFYQLISGLFGFKLRLYI
jgi:hypothetical protein